MEHKRVNLLNAACGVGWHDNFVIARTSRLATTPPCEQHRGNAQGFCGSKGGKHIGAIAARGEADQYIARLPKRLDPAGKYLFVAVIVADAGDRSRIGIETDGRQRWTVPVIPADKFLGKVHGIRRATSITAGEELAAAFQRFENGNAGGIDLRREGFRRLEGGAEFRDGVDE